MLKKATNRVLASLRGSTYGTEYASPPRSLRPCWMVFLSILRCRSSSRETLQSIMTIGIEKRFSEVC